MVDREALVKAYEHKKRMLRNGNQFKKWLTTVRNGEFKLTGIYDGNHRKTKITHTVCGFERTLTPAQFKQDSFCPICDDTKRTDESFRCELKLKYGDQYIPLTKYINTDNPMYFFHKDCGKVIRMRPVLLLNSSQCGNCYGTHKLSKLEVQQQLNAINKDMFLIHSGTRKEKITLRYLSCGHKQTSWFKYIQKYPECPTCKKQIERRTKAKNFAKQVNNLGVVKVWGSYISDTNLVQVKCVKCGYIWSTNPGPLKSGHGCPVCKSSKGEGIISKLLNVYSISYQYPKQFKNLRGSKKPLHYDFYIPSQNILIEYQGLQHYEPIDYFGGEKQFDRQQKHDQLKRDYARKNGYNLIEVPYIEDTYEKIKEYLIKKGLELK